jgi:hypothetical protein
MHAQYDVIVVDNHDAVLVGGTWLPFDMLVSVHVPQLNVGVARCQQSVLISTLHSDHLSCISSITLQLFLFNAVERPQLDSAITFARRQRSPAHVVCRQAALAHNASCACARSQARPELMRELVSLCASVRSEAAWL